MRALILVALECCVLLSPARAGGMTQANAGGRPVWREEVFAFAQKPAIRVLGRDRYEIAFTSSRECDVTIAILDAKGKIIRHLASGVLGANAPAPFRKSSLSQKVVWDGKDDFGLYVENPAAFRVRVSLGLKPKLGKIMGWHPKNTTAARAIVALAADRDGVYSIEFHPTRPQVRAYRHDGGYSHTVLPFPAGTIGKQVGKKLYTFPDGTQTYHRISFAFGNVLPEHAHFTPQTVAIHDGVISALTHFGHVLKMVVRLGTDGTTRGQPLEGATLNHHGGRLGLGNSCELAASPDGKWLYVTNLGAKRGHQAIPLHAVYRMRWDRKGPLDWAQPFIGEVKVKGTGKHIEVEGVPETDERRFNTPVGIACDAAGRIYVSDFGNNRVQVFSPDGKHLKAVKVEKPGRLSVDPVRGTVYVVADRTHRKGTWAFEVRKLSAWPKLEVVAVQKFGDSTAYEAIGGDDRSVAEMLRSFSPVLCIDAWAEVPTLWITARRGQIELWADRGGSFELLRSFVDEVKKAGVLPHFQAGNWNTYMSADPIRPHLYYMCGSYRFDTDTGKVEHVDMREDGKGRRAMGSGRFGVGGLDDFVIGPDGLAYTRTTKYLGRFDPETWREVPFDYGEPCELRWGYTLRGGIVFPWKGSPHFHMGMGVAHNGDIIVSAISSALPHEFCFQRGNVRGFAHIRRPSHEYYVPRLYPGRLFMHENVIFVWRTNGELKLEDAVKGVTIASSGVRGDFEGNIYVGFAVPKLLDGKPLHGKSLVKFGPEGGKFIWSGSRPVSLREEPDRPPEFEGGGGGGGKVWTHGALWSFGGYETMTGIGSCICPNGRFDVDYYGRVFIPESHRCTVAVLDTAGNFITRIGTYGNADSGRGPDSPIKVGGPEIAIAYCTYVAAHPQERVFLADDGNQRVIDVRIEYETGATLPISGKGEAGRRD